MVNVVKYDEIKDLVGQETGVSDWFEVTQDKVNMFADATGDHQWIHVGRGSEPRKSCPPVVRSPMVT